MRPATKDVARSATGNVPFGVMVVLFWPVGAASSARSVAFSFIHTNDMPVFLPISLPAFLPLSDAFPVSSLPPNALRGGQNLNRR
jgi:hypothetical protein